MKKKIARIAHVSISGEKGLCGASLGEQWVGSSRVVEGRYDKDSFLKLCPDCVKVLEKDHPCPKCGAPGEEICAGCGRPTSDDCGCPAGTAYRCSNRCDKPDAIKRAAEMMNIPTADLPMVAYSYSQFLCRKYGGCGEIFMTAFAHYAQKIEGLPCSDSLYQVNETDWAEFIGPMRKEK